MAAAAAISSFLSFPALLPTPPPLPRQQQHTLLPRCRSLLACRQPCALRPVFCVRRGTLCLRRRFLNLTAFRASAQEEGNTGGEAAEVPKPSPEGGTSAADGDNAEAAEAAQATARRILSERAGGGGWGGDLWGGVAEEVREIEWPAFGKVVGTTGVVLAVIAGSSVALLTVNAVLAELSDRVFAGRGLQDFF